jgi:hypothetical protein
MRWLMLKVAEGAGAIFSYTSLSRIAGLWASSSSVPAAIRPCLSQPALVRFNPVIIQSDRKRGQGVEIEPEAAASELRSTVESVRQRLRERITGGT